MKRRYAVEWYEYDLTRKRTKKFFTEMGASLYVWYLRNYRFATAIIYEI